MIQWLKFVDRLTHSIQLASKNESHEGVMKSQHSFELLEKTNVTFGVAMVSILASGPNCPGFNSSIPKVLSEETIVNFVEVIQQRCLEEIGQWHVNVHLVLI